MNKQFIQAATSRAIRTGAQTLLSMITVGMALTDIDWKQAVSVTLVAMLTSVLTSITTGLPEAEASGAFIVDDSDPDTTKWTLQYNGDPDQIKIGDKLSLTVMNNYDVDIFGGDKSIILSNSNSFGGNNTFLGEK